MLFCTVDLKMGYKNVPKPYRAVGVGNDENSFNITFYKSVQKRTNNLRLKSLLLFLMVLLLLFYRGNPSI